MPLISSASRMATLMRQKRFVVKVWNCNRISIKAAAGCIERVDATITSGELNGAFMAIHSQLRLDHYGIRLARLEAVFSRTECHTAGQRG